MSRWISPINPPLLLLCSSFLYKKGIIFKPHDVLTWHFSCSWAHRFVVFVFLSFSDFVILLLVAVSSIFGCIFLFYLMMLGVRREFWFLGEFNAFLFSKSTRMNRHFPSCRYIICCICNKEWGDRNMHLWLTCYFVRLAKLFIRAGILFQCYLKVTCCDWSVHTAS